MKIFIIFIFIFLLTMAFNVSMDMLIGLPLRNSLKNLYNPFWVKGGPELVTTFVLILIWVTPLIFSSIRAKREKKHK
ncbi:MAG: hypothetical protein K0Q73_5341 [Paenibacillus sp.]|nr:hypothetical protein [Paenibacillus sp.]